MDGSGKTLHVKRNIQWRTCSSPHTPAGKRDDVCDRSSSVLHETRLNLHFIKPGLNRHAETLFNKKLRAGMKWI